MSRPDQDRRTEIGFHDLAEYPLDPESPRGEMPRPGTCGQAASSRAPGPGCGLRAAVATILRGDR